MNEIDKTEYLKNLEMFENFLDFAIDVSDNTVGIKASSHLIQANQLYTRFTMTSLAITRLLPRSKMFPSKWDLWDFFSVASLTRNLIENYHMFYYIGVEEISDEEREFRLELIYFHSNWEKYRLYKEYNAKEENLTDFIENLPKAEEVLKNHAFFKKLTKEQVGKIFKQKDKAKDAMYLTHKEISSRIKFENGEFTPTYRLLSNHSHSTPFAYLTMSNDRGRGIENEAEIYYLTMCLDICIKYLSASILDMVKLFPVCKNKLNQKKLEIVSNKFKDYIK